MIQVLLLTICLAVFPYQGRSIILKSGKVDDYETVYPQKVPALPKGGVQWHEKKPKYEDTMKYEFKVNGEPVVLRLEKNKQLFSKDYTETHYSPDGREITTSPEVEDHCYYHGHIEDDIDSTAIISACDGLNGYFKHQGEMYLIEPLKLSDSEAHAVFKYESLEKEDETPKICGVTHPTWKAVDPIKKTAKLFMTPEKEKELLEIPKFVQLYMVADNLMCRKYSGNIANLKERMFEIINYVNVFYKALNIHIAVIGTEIWCDKDKIMVNGSAIPTLLSFAEWRQTVLLKHKRNDNGHLITGVHFDDGILGLAFNSGMCDSYKSAAVIQDNSLKALITAVIMAHEMGHNLGMDHDQDSCTCKDAPCIMKPKLTHPTPQEFSSCSFWDFQKFIMTKESRCILNEPSSTDIVTTTVCGNGFVEEGEECDCGSSTECKNECCEAATCKLKPGAKCADGGCCERCQFRTAGAECRVSKDDCDLPEHCTGQSAECPMNRFQKNGHPCQNNLGYCFRGTCPTLTNQCIALFGPDAKVAPDTCFLKNQKGDTNGHCTNEEDINIPCKEKDVKCGRLYCTDGSGDKKSCNFHISKEISEYGMVDPGTKCGEGMVCNYGQCVDIKTLY